MQKSRRSFFVLLALVSFLNGAVAENPSFPEPFDTQKLVVPLTSPEVAARSFTVPPGFTVSLFAGEPDVQNPIALATDARGRLWVAENYTYAEPGVKFEKKLRDRIVVFEDANQDGRFDKRTVFWDGGERVTSVEVGFGGVWVLAPPRLLFFPDRNGDDKPDGPPEIVLDGINDFSAASNHHNLANGLRWGPDGWLYARHGISGDSLIGTPGAPPEKRAAINAGIWRYHPQRRVTEAVVHGTTNPWGHDWDEHGELFFINTVTGHLWHGVQGMHVQRMFGDDINPHSYELLPQVADHYHWDTGKKWTESRDAAGLSDALGGGHAHSGAMIYLGNNWPANFHNHLFTLNFHGKRMNQDVLERVGAGYVGRHGQDVFRSTDPWYRGIDLLYGADGGVFVADWADLGECHDHDGVHRHSGRIYKIWHGTPAPVKAFDLRQLDQAGLMALQNHDNEWYARQARIELQDRAARGDLQRQSAVEALRKMYSGAKDPVRQLRALWCLNAVGALDENFLLRELARAKNEHVRVWAVRLLVDGGAPSAQVRTSLVRAAREDASGLVLLYLASSLQRLAPGDRWELAGALAGRSAFAADRDLPLLAWYGVEESVAGNGDAAVKLAMSTEWPRLHRFIARRLTADLEKQKEPLNRLVVLAAGRPAAFQREVLGGMAEAMRGWRKAAQPAGWAEAGGRFARSGDETVRRLGAELSVVFGDGRGLDELRRIAVSKEASVEARRDAIRVLAENDREGALPLLQQLLGDYEVGGAAVRGLAQLKGGETPRLLLDNYGKIDFRTRPEVMTTLSSRAPWARALLEEVKAGRIPRHDVGAYQIRQIRQFKDPALDGLIVAIWPELKKSSGDLAKSIERWKGLLTAERITRADPKQGHAVFSRLCAPCHKLAGEGGNFGPDLTGADRANLDYLLGNIIDPNLTVADAFRMSNVTLKDGRVISGVVGVRTGKTVAIQTPTEKVMVEEGQVETIERSELSPMPEGLIDPLDEKEVANLIAFLMGRR